MSTYGRQAREYLLEAVELSGKLKGSNRLTRKQLRELLSQMTTLLVYLLAVNDKYGESTSVMKIDDATFAKMFGDKGDPEVKEDPESYSGHYL